MEDLVDGEEGCVVGIGGGCVHFLKAGVREI